MTIQETWPSIEAIIQEVAQAWTQTRNFLMQQTAGKWCKTKVGNRTATVLLKHSGPDSDCPLHSLQALSNNVNVTEKTEMPYTDNKDQPFTWSIGTRRRKIHKMLCLHTHYPQVDSQSKSLLANVMTCQTLDRHPNISCKTPLVNVINSLMETTRCSPQDNNFMIYKPNWDERNLWIQFNMWCKLLQTKTENNMTLWQHWLNFTWTMQQKDRD